MDPVEPKVYKEGLLFKRQRGLHQSSTKKLKFQERFIRLTSTSLDYYVPNPKKRTEGPKGQFAVEQLRIVEELPPCIFGKEYPHVFQIGDNVEIMYFAAKTSKDRDEWLEACRTASSDWGNKMLSHYHKGVYGLVNKGRWSCCANPTRACSGCSPVTPGEVDLTKSYAGGSRSLPLDAKEQIFSTTLPSPITCQPSPRSTHSSTSFPGEMTDSVSSTASVRTLTKSTTLTDTAEELAPMAPPIIRSFTLANPANVVHRPDPKRIQELRNSRTLTQDLEEAELKAKKEAEKREGEERQKEEVSVEEFKDKNNDLGELSKIALELQGDVAASRKESNRSGASSPSPSIDSGKGGSSGTGSRPNSQVINMEENIMRAVRSESVGKKSTQSTQSDQGVVADEGTGSRGLQKQTPVEEPDGPQPPSSPAPRPTSADDSKEKDDRQGEEKDNKEETNGTEKREEKERHDEVEKKQEIIKTRRKMSSPVERTPTPDNSKPRQRPMSEMSSSGSIDNLKTMIGNRSSLYSSGSDMSGPITPQHRKYISSSPRIGERPRSTLLRGLSIIADQSSTSYGLQFNRIHRACEDGNLEVLEEELNEKLNEQMVDLNEPSYTPVPYTPLFIAFMNDHYQTMVCLLAHGANPNCTEPQNKASVLHWACERGCVDVVELLIGYNADVNLTDNYGTTPLMEACKHGHLDIVKILLQKGVQVDQEGRNKRTSLHEASDAGHSTIAEMLIKEGADPILHDSTNSTPYDLAFQKGHKTVMMVLQQLIPESVRPYSLLRSHTIPSSQMITTLAFNGVDVLISGSRDCHACFWDTSDLSVMRCVRVTNTVLRADIQGGFLAIGSTSVQLVDTCNLDKRRTVADDTVSDESLENPPLHLVAFGPKGRLVTAAVESNIVKLWPPISPNSSIVTTPESSITVTHKQNVKEPGCVYSLSVSPSPNSPWLAVGLQPGKMFQPTGNKLVYLYNWETRERHQIFDAGGGGLAVSVHTTFSPDGHHLAIGCSENLCVWEAQSGNLLYKLTMSDDVYISSVSYSPDATHLAAGLSTGEVEVFEMTSSSSIFTLSKPETPSPATSMAYTEDGKLFAVGHQNGVLQLWEGKQSWISAL